VKGRRRKLIVEDLKEMTVSWNFKEKLLDRIFWRTGFEIFIKSNFIQVKISITLNNIKVIGNDIMTYYHRL
jgi:hypothetical protein